MLNFIQDTSLQDIQNMTPAQLKQYLKVIFETDGLGAAPLEELEKKGVSGRVFLTMKEEDFKNEIPSASFGTRRTFSIIIEEHSQPLEQNPLPEYFRKFDTTARQTNIILVLVWMCPITLELKQQNL